MIPARPRRPADESGFTLIEVLISIIVLGLIASGVAAAIILFFKTADGTSSRLALSHDSQLLATYLIPDLDSLTGATPAGQPIVTAPNGQKPPQCQLPGESGVSFGQKGAAVQISFTDLSTQNLYVAEYSVDMSETVITRKLFLHGNQQSSIVVVHNLKAPDKACFSDPGGAAPWTMTIETGRPGPASPDDYTFSVAGGGRVTPPTPLGAPKLCGPPQCISPALVSHDTKNDGHIDQVVATFDQPLAQVPPNATDQWQLSGPITVKSVAVSGNQAVLTLNNPQSAVDTVEGGFKVGLTLDNTNGIRNGANQAAQFPATLVTDGMAPVPTKIVVQNRDGDGRADHVVVTFSEPILSSTNTAQWTLNGLKGVSVNPVTVVTGTKTATLTLNEGIAVDTVASTFSVALMADPTGIQDSQGNQSSFPATKPADQMKPAPLSIVARDPYVNGEVVYQVDLTFSEPLRPSTDVTPWSLGNVPSNVTIKSVNVGDPLSPNTATLILDVAGTFDTAVNGWQISLAANPPGVQSATTGNVSFFGASNVSDGMNPVVVALSSTNTNRGTAGKLEKGDTLTLTFSEPLAKSSLPANPNVKLTPGTGTGNDMLSISGLATVDLGAQNAYVASSSVTFNATLTSTNGVVTIAVGDIASGTGVVLQATAHTVTVTPSGTVTDVEGDHAAAVFTSGSPMVLF